MLFLMATIPRYDWGYAHHSYEKKVNTSSISPTKHRNGTFPFQLVFFFDMPFQLVSIKQTRETDIFLSNRNITLHSTSPSPNTLKVLIARHTGIYVVEVLQRKHKLKHLRI
jgi:hypothetical protein